MRHTGCMATTKSKKVTAAKADRAILASVALIECDDFQEAARDAGHGATALRDLDRAADIARALRDRA
jgi:hypothetical protein